MYDNSLVVVGEGVGKVGDDHLGAYHDRDDGGDVMMMVVMMMIAMVKIVMVIDNDDAGDDAH